MQKQKNRQAQNVQNLPTMIHIFLAIRKIIFSLKAKHNFDLFYTNQNFSLLFSI
jgi:hypothetical protein